METAASILIVEDEAVVALDLKVELEGLGYRVVGIADTADQAEAMARLHRPTLVLMDIMLKGDVDGIGAADALRRSVGTPVVFLTSYSDAETVARAALTAAYGYLTKPFQLKELRAGIEIAISKSRLERQLREADRWFALTLRCVQDGVVVVDEGGRVRFMNAAAEALTGFAAERAVGQPIDAVVRFERGSTAGPVPAPAPQTLVPRALGEGRVVGIRYARRLVAAGGVRVPVDESAGPIHDDDGRRMGAVLVLRDARERLRHEALLRASEERFRSAFDFAPLGMALLSLDRRFLQVNEALCRLLGRDAASLLETPEAALGPADDADHEAARLAELRDGHAPVTQFEKRYLAAGGGPPVSVLVSASLLRDGGAPTCYLYQVHDLTAQKLAAAQLAELADVRIRREASDLADRSRSEFLSRVSHEMRTPLNAVLGFADLLKRREVESEVAGRYSEHILTAGRHLLALVDDLLDLQRANDGQLQLALGRVELDTALPASIALLALQAAERGVGLEQSVGPGLAAHADPTRLRQIVLNLGSNAVKYNTPGGRVVFGARAVGAGRIEISVQDSGIGMSDEQLAHLFEPFNRLGREALRVPGVGLGLVITRRLVEQMGGAMAVARGDDGGTVVTLELPAAEGAKSDGLAA